MRETDLQTRNIKVIQAMGGNAHKSSNAVTVGVCDIIGKFPTCDTWYMEAKLEKPGPKTTSIKLALTVPQVRWLQKYHDVGAPCFALAYVQKGRLAVSVRLVPWVEFAALPEQTIGLDRFTFGKSWETEMEREFSRWRDLLGRN
jgi:hypothetical protein